MQAPKTRKDPRNRRATLLVAAAVAAALLVGGAVAAFLLLRDDSGSASVQQAMSDAGCSFREVKALPSGVHISDANKPPKEWNTFPPTSGPHFGQWVIWGEYDQPVRLTEAVHNLEHGGIVMYYGKDVPQDEVSKLREFYRSDPVAMLLSPLPKLNDKIVLTAWNAPEAGQTSNPSPGNGILAECSKFDEDAFETFRDTYRFKGPERIPPESLQPGS